MLNPAQEAADPSGIPIMIHMGQTVSPLTKLLPILKRSLERLGMKTQGPLLYDPTAASYNSEADDIVKGNPDAYVILDFPANYAKIGSALLRTGKFNGRKLFVAGRRRSPTSSPRLRSRARAARLRARRRVRRPLTRSTSCSPPSRARSSARPSTRTTSTAR